MEIKNDLGIFAFSVKIRLGMVSKQVHSITYKKILIFGLNLKNLTHQNSDSQKEQTKEFPSL